MTTTELLGMKGSSVKEEPGMASSGKGQRRERKKAVPLGWETLEDMTHHPFEISRQGDMGFEKVLGGDRSPFHQLSLRDGN